MLRTKDKNATDEAPIPRGSKGDVVYERLKRWIMLGRLKPGQPVVELKLAAEIGCSQGPVREALLRLQEDGLVRREGYRGTSVSTTTPTEASEMFFLRITIETRGIRQSVDAIDDATLDSLGSLIRDMEAAARDDDEYGLSEIDREFHLRLFDIADLPAIRPILHRCLLHNHRFKIAVPEKRRTLAETASRHWNIERALRRRDPDACEAILRHHIETIVDTGDTRTGAA